MSVALPNGALFAIASTYGAVKSMTAISNAVGAVATLEASHGVIVSDVVEVTSGWTKLNGRLAKATAVATNDVTFGGIDTSNTTRYPAGSGIGSVREVTAWTQLSQVLDVQTSGGDQGFATYSFLEDDTEHQIPTVRSPITLNIDLGDDATLPWYAVLSAADEDRLVRALRLTLPSGAIIYYNGIVSLNRTPTLTKNNVMALKATFSLQSAPTRY